MKLVRCNKKPEGELVKVGRKFEIKGHAIQAYELSLDDGLIIYEHDETVDAWFGREEDAEENSY